MKSLRRLNAGLTRSNFSCPSEQTGPEVKLNPVPTPPMADLTSLPDMTWSFLAQVPPDDILGLVMYAQAMTLAMAELKVRVEQLERMNDDNH